MLALAGMVLLMVVLATRMRRQRLDPQKLLGAIRGGRNPEQLSQAADAFDEAGYHDTAEALRVRAGELSARRAQPGPTLLTSPLPGVPDDAWTRFVLELAAASPGARSARGYLGMFGFGLERLQDLGYLKKTRKDGSGGPVVEWRASLSEKGFLASPEVQYRAFGESMADYRKLILARRSAVLGKMLAGRPATLSGLLAAAHQAGLRGLESWLDAGGDRTRYPNTTAAYLKCVGLF